MQSSERVCNQRSWLSRRIPRSVATKVEVEVRRQFRSGSALFSLLSSHRSRLHLHLLVAVSSSKFFFFFFTSDACGLSRITRADSLHARVRRPAENPLRTYYKRTFDMWLTWFRCSVPRRNKHDCRGGYPCSRTYENALSTPLSHEYAQHVLFSIFFIWWSLLYHCNESR